MTFSSDLLPRVIPVLALKRDHFVQTRGFSDPVYVGDPLNIMNIFNNFEVDELIICDIDAARGNHTIQWRILKQLADYSSVPLSYGGGITSLEDAAKVIRLGFEKVVISSQLQNIALISSISRYLGSQALVASIDIIESNSIRYLCSKGSNVKNEVDIELFLRNLESAGVGEFLLQDVSRDGSRSGLNHELFRNLTRNLNVPTLWKGGLQNSLDAKKAVSYGASGVAGTSFFVFQSDRGSTLISYPYIFRDAPDNNRISPLKSSGTNLTSTYLDGKMCARCVITDKVPGSDLKKTAICYYCQIHGELDRQYPTGAVGETLFKQFCATLRSQKNSGHHCIIGVSGGTDSSYLAMRLVEEGVKPLAVHFDNTWNTSIAAANIHNLVNVLDLDLETVVIDNFEYDTIIRSFLQAGVVDLEAATDIGFMGFLYKTAEKYKIRNIVEGHSFRTEGISPIGWLYMDGRYIESVVWEYAKKELKTFPNIKLWNQIKWATLSNLKRTRPLYWLDYDKSQARVELEKSLGWKWYGGHHLENNLSAFFHSHFLPSRFGIDYRQIEFSALVRSGQMERKDAIENLQKGRLYPDELISLVKDRLKLDDFDFETLMSQPIKTFENFKTYKQDFERLRLLFFVLMKLGRVPESFYKKYCLPLP